MNIFETRNCIETSPTCNTSFQPINSDITVVEQQNLNATSNYKLVGNKKITRERSLKYVIQDRDENKQIRKEISTEYDLSMITSSTESMLLNLYEYVTIVNIDKNLTVTSNSSNEKFVERMIPIEVKKIKFSLIISKWIILFPIMIQRGNYVV